MRKFAIVILLVLPFLLMTVISLVSKVIIQNAIVDIDSIVISNENIIMEDKLKTITIDYDDKYQIEVLISPTKVTHKELVFFSGDSSIINVNKDTGLVTAVGYGATKVYVSTYENPNIKDEILFIVSNKKVYSVYLETSIIELNKGKTQKLVPIILPSTATNKKVKYESSDSKIATVDSNGNVKAIKNGTAYIKVTTEDGNKQVTATINVVSIPGKIFDYNSLTLCSSILQLDFDDLTDKEPEFISSDNTIATVNEFGEVTFLKTGIVTISVNLNDGQFDEVVLNHVIDEVTSFDIDKTDLYFDMGDDTTADYEVFYYQITPYDTASLLSYEVISGEGTVDVVIDKDYNNIIITAIKAGTTIIEFELGEITRTLEVTVVKPPRSISWDESISRIISEERALTIGKTSEVEIPYIIDDLNGTTCNESKLVVEAVGNSSLTTNDIIEVTSTGIKFKVTGQFNMYVESSCGSKTVIKTPTLLVNINYGINVKTVSEIQELLVDKTTSDSVTINLLNNISLTQSDFGFYSKYFAINNPVNGSISGNEAKLIGSAITINCNLDFYGNGYQMSAKDIALKNPIEYQDTNGLYFADNYHKRSIIVISGPNLNVSINDLSLIGNNRQEEVKKYLDTNHCGTYIEDEREKKVEVSAEFVSGIEIIDQVYTENLRKYYTKHSSLFTANEYAQIYNYGLSDSTPFTMLNSVVINNVFIREAMNAISARNINNLLLSNCTIQEISSVGVSIRQVAHTEINNFTSGYTNSVPLEFLTTNSLLCGPTRDAYGRGSAQEIEFTGYFKSSSWISGYESGIPSDYSSAIAALLSNTVTFRPTILDQGVFRLKIEDGSKTTSISTKVARYYAVVPYFIASEATSFHTAQIIKYNSDGSVAGIETKDMVNEKDVRVFGNHSKVSAANMYEINQMDSTPLPYLNSMVYFNMTVLGIDIQFAMLAVDASQFAEDARYPYLIVDCDRINQ